MKKSVAVVQDIKEAIIDLVGGMGWLSYPQLIRGLDHRGFITEGDSFIKSGEDPTIFWSHLSNEVTSALLELLTEDEIRHIAAPLDVYKIDGVRFMVPVVFEKPEHLPKDHPPVMFPSLLMHKALFDQNNERELKEMQEIERLLERRSQ